MLFLSLILLSLLFTDCNKDTNILDEKQYLFDGLPYYLTDTLYYLEGSSLKPVNAFRMQLDSKGYAWIIDYFLRLMRYDYTTKELIQWNTKEILGIDDPPYNMIEIYIDSRDRIWCAHQVAGILYMFEGTSVKTLTLDDTPRGMCEDSEGKIHMYGIRNKKEYICDGETIVRNDPPFVEGDYHIYSINSDRQKNLWYHVDRGITSIGTDIVKYCGGNDYTVMPKLPNANNGGHMTSDNIAFDSDNKAYLAARNIVCSLDINNAWVTVCSWGIFDYIYFRELFFDYDDNLWSALSPSANLDDPKLIAIVKDGECITESLNAKVIQDRVMIDDICFPDENTVWVCEGRVFVFKK